MFTLGYRFRPWTDTRAIADGATIREYVRDTARERGHRPAPCGTGTGWWRRSGRARPRAGPSRPRRPTGDRRADLRVPLPVHRLLPLRPGPRARAARRRAVRRRDRAPAVLARGPAVGREAGGRRRQRRHRRHPGPRPGPRRRARDDAAALPQLRAVGADPRPAGPAPVRPAPGAVGRAGGARAQHRPDRRWSTGSAAVSPTWMRRRLLDGARAQLPPGFDVDTHFSPTYDPWDQRLCVVPSGDLFRAVRGGRASVVTDQDHDADRARRARSRRATSCPRTSSSPPRASPCSCSAARRCGSTAATSTSHRTVVYKGALLSGLPNLALTFGYPNASWTLKADLVATYVCRLLRLHAGARRRRRRAGRAARRPRRACRR